MKKIAIVLAVLMAAAPAMAVVTITATQVGTTADVDITATTSGEGQLPRAFALDITVDSDADIIGISDFFAGECDDVNRGYGIFPASFAREIDADDPNWADVNYTPVAEQGDLPSDTQGGIDTNGITIEMGSLYVDDNSPPNPATLCTITVSGSCYVSLALNIGRGKIVMEDGSEPASVVLNGTAVTLVCTVPGVVGDTNAVAQAAIIDAGFTIGNRTADCNDTIAAGNVISTNPAADATPGCDTAVDMVVSTGPCECYTGPDYDEWVIVDRPDSWCDPRQCHGDSDNAEDYLGFGQYAWVGPTDRDNFNLAYRVRVGQPGENLACDFDHLSFHMGFGQYTRCGPDDRDIMLNYYRGRTGTVEEPPADCLTDNPVSP